MMWRAVVYIFCLLLAISSCAKKKQGVGCVNPDPATGACLGEEAAISDPDDTAAVLKRASQSQAAARLEIARLQKEKDVRQAGIDSGERPASDQAKVDEVGEMIIAIVAEGTKKGHLLSSKPTVDTSKVPGVILTLKNKDKRGVRPKFEFNHVTGVSGIELYYGGEGGTQAFNFSGRTRGEMPLTSVKIPVILRFKFNETQHCAKAEINSTYEDGRRAMTVEVCK